MCNAMHHKKGCQCGWGAGDGVVKTSFSYPLRILEIRNSIASMTIPNARCPVCKDPVFYYCNSYGSSVFFDELGPPWAKHPCTDNKSYPKLISTGDALSAKRSMPLWVREGWELCSIDSIVGVDRDVLQLTMTLIPNNSTVKAFVHEVPTIHPRSLKKLVSIDSFAFIKTDGDDRYILSTLFHDAEAYRFRIYRIKSDLKKYACELTFGKKA